VDQAEEEPEPITSSLLKREQIDEKRDPVYGKEDERDQMLFGRNFSFYEL